MNLKIEELLFKVNRWHQNGDHRAIIETIGSEKLEDLNYELTLRLAQAYLGSTKPRHKDFEEKLDYAERLLLAIEDSGLSSAEWCYAMGRALYLQNREAEGLPYLERAVDLDPDDTDYRRLREATYREIENRTKVADMDISRVAQFYDANDWAYSMDTEEGILRSSFKSSVHCYEVNESLLTCDYIWRPDVPAKYANDMIRVCNEWNSSKKMPKVSVTFREDDVVWVIAQTVAFSGAGFTRKQLISHLLWSIKTTDQFFDSLAEDFPQLLEPEEGTEDSSDQAE